jgi:hypothetical protein
MSQELTVVQKNYLTLSSEKGFDAFIKLFELSGNEPAQAKSLAEKEAYHLAQLMSENSDLANIPPSALVMEIRKIGSHNGLLHIIPKMNSKSKVVGGILTIIWSDGRSTQDVFRESHIDSWRNRSAKRFNGKANANYTSFNGGMEPGFIQSKMLKHKLDRVGINPFPGAYKKLRTGQIESLPEETSPSVVVDDAEPVVVGTKIEKQVSENGNSEPQDIEFENL